MHEAFGTNYERLLALKRPWGPRQPLPLQHQHRPDMKLESPRAETRARLKQLLVCPRRRARSAQAVPGGPARWEAARPRLCSAVPVRVGVQRPVTTGRPSPRCRARWSSASHRIGTAARMAAVRRYQGTLYDSNRWDGFELAGDIIIAAPPKCGTTWTQMICALLILNPHGEPGGTGPDGQPWPMLDTVRPWDSLSPDEQRLFARMAEVFAGFISYNDHQLGRVLDYLEESGQLDNTLVIVISDNGASGEGGPNGSFNEWRFFNGVADTTEVTLPHIDELGTPEVVQPLQHRLGLGLRHAVPLLEALGRLTRAAWPTCASSPGRRRSRPTRAPPPVHPRRRRRPDDLRAARHRAPRGDQGLHPEPDRGREFRRRAHRPRRHRARRRSSTRCSASARSTTRAGWPRTVHPPIAGWGNFDQDEWELYHLDDDRAQATNLAAERTRPAGDAEEPLVLLRGHLQRAAARRPHRARAGARRAAARRRPATGTCTTPTPPTCPRRPARRSTAARTRSPPGSRSTPPTPKACSTPTAAWPAATAST